MVKTLHRTYIHTYTHTHTHTHAQKEQVEDGEGVIYKQYIKGFPGFTVLVEEK